MVNKKTKFATWKWTYDISSTFKSIDFYKVINGKYYVASLKSCNRANLQSLLDDTKFIKHLKDLAVGARDEIFEDAGEKIKANEVHLYIAVPQDKLNIFEGIEDKIHKMNIEHIKKVKVFLTTIEDAVGI